MIQRIQSLHLLAAVAIMVATLFYPLAWFASPDTVYTLYAFSLVDSAGAVQQTPLYLGIILVLAAVLPFVNIFLFKNRMLQVRLCVVEAVLLIGVMILGAIYYFRFGALLADMGCDAEGVRALALMPLFALLFTWLAGRAIMKDEILVRAVDRIR